MTSGDYVLDRGEGASGRRLGSLLEDRFDGFTTETMERLGVDRGWRCLELGAGAGSMTGWLCDRVGEGGSVVAMDLSVELLRALEFPQLELREGDAVQDELGDGEFDLVYTRWTLLHIPERERVLQKLIAAVKPGGWILCVEPHRLDWDSLDESVPAELRREQEVAQQWVAADRAKRGVEWRFGRSIYSRLKRAGFVELGAEGRMDLRLGGTPRGDAFHETQAQFRRAAGMSEAEIDAQLAHLSSPDLVNWDDPAIATWGRRPG